MKKVVRLTESDMMRIVKKVLNEQSGTAGQYCINEVEDWADIDDDVKQTGTWSLRGNKIQLIYKRLFGNDDPVLIDKPIDFEKKMSNKKTGKFQKSFDKDRAPYGICFF